MDRLSLFLVRGLSTGLHSVRDVGGLVVRGRSVGFRHLEVVLVSLFKHTKVFTKSYSRFFTVFQFY